MMPPDVLAPRQAGGQNDSMETAELPENLDLCHGMIRELSASLRGARRRIEQLEHRLDLLLRRIYGPRSERLDPDQRLLFAEEADDHSGPALQDAPAPEARQKPGRPGKGHGRRGLPADLPRERRV